MYVRNIIIDYRVLDELLHLPEGFKIDQVYMSPDHWGYIIRVLCPKKNEFYVNQGREIPLIQPHGVQYTSDTKEHRVFYYYPELGQEVPKNPFNKEQS